MFVCLLLQTPIVKQVLKRVLYLSLYISVTATLSCHPVAYYPIRTTVLKETLGEKIPGQVHLSDHAAPTDNTGTATMRMIESPAGAEGLHKIESLTLLIRPLPHVGTVAVEERVMRRRIRKTKSSLRLSAGAANHNGRATRIIVNPTPAADGMQKTKG